MKLSVIFVNYKDKAHLLDALEALFASKVDFEFEAVVVDQDSKDNSLAEVEERFCKKQGLASRLQLIQNINDGFVGGNNLGIRKARGEYVLLLNCDTKVAPETLQVMMDFMKAHPEVGISTCKLVKGNGELDWACRRSFPDPWVSFFRLSGLSKLFPKNKKLAAYNLTYKSIDEETEIDACVGAFMFISPQCLKALRSFTKYETDEIRTNTTSPQSSPPGGRRQDTYFDTDFYMYGEDLDMCYRAKEAGFKIWYYPKTTTIHYKGQSSRKAPKRALYAFHDAMWIFYKKHLYPKYPRPFSWLVYTGIWGRYYVKRLENVFRKEKIVSK